MGLKFSPKNVGGEKRSGPVHARLPSLNTIEGSLFSFTFLFLLLLLFYFRDKIHAPGSLSYSESRRRRTRTEIPRLPPSRLCRHSGEIINFFFFFFLLLREFELLSFSFFLFRLFLLPWVYRDRCCFPRHCRAMYIYYPFQLLLYIFSICLLSLGRPGVSSLLVFCLLLGCSPLCPPLFPVHSQKLSIGIRRTRSLNRRRRNGGSF